MSSVVSASEKLLILINGAYGERMAKIDEQLWRSRIAVKLLFEIDRSF